MTRGDYIKAMAGRGWLLFRVSKETGRTSFVCKHIGCHGASIVSDHQIARGDVPRGCLKRHVRRYAGTLINDHIALQEHLRQARVRFGLSQEDVEAAAGLSVDHIGKLEIQERTATFPTYWAWAQTLGFDIVLMPKPLPDSVVAIIEHKNGQPVPERRPPTPLLLTAQGSGGQGSAPLLEVQPGTLSAVEDIASLTG